MDEENTVPAENIDVAEDSSVDTSPVDETNTSVESETNSDAGEETQVTEPAAGETEESTEHKPTRAERRIRQLAEQNRQLRSQPNQFAPGFQQPPQLGVQPGQELSMEDYQSHVAQAAKSVVDSELQNLRGEFETKEALRNFDADMEVIETKYPELSNDTPAAAALEEAITEAYKEKAYRLVGFDPYTNQPQYRIDPSVRLADIAAKEVERARLYAQQASAEMKNAVATQADNTALKPGASAKGERAFRDLSVNEMEAQLGIVRQ